MTIQEANNIIETFYTLEKPTTEERADFAEAMNYLYDETGDTDFLVALGTMYYEQDMFEFGLQYFMLAADKGNVTTPLPEIFADQAETFVNMDKKEDALTLLDEARKYLAQRIAADPLFDDLGLMRHIVMNTYNLRKLDPEKMDLYDLFYALRIPRRVQFSCFGQRHEAQSAFSGAGITVRFDDTKYASIDDFYSLAAIDGKLLTSLYRDLRGFKIAF